MLAAVRLFNVDVQVAGAAGGVQIVNFKGAGSDGGFINAVTILINRDLRGGARDPSNRRRKAMQAIRQHLFVRTELQTGKTQTVENAGRGIRITDHQLAA